MRRTPTLALLASALLSGCHPAGPATPAKTATPAKVEKMPGEADLTTVTLTPEAETRLRLKTAAVEAKQVLRTRTLGGEVVIPPGHAIIVAAPLAGTLFAPAAGLPAPGTPVTKGQVIFNLLPLLSPDSRITLATTRVEAEGQVKQGEAQVADLKQRFERAEKLYEQKLGGIASVDDARAALNGALATLKAASTRRDAIDAAIKGAEGGAIPSVPITAEMSGMLRTLSVTAGQKVAGGTVLFEVVQLDPIHLRVPVFVGDLAKLDDAQPAVVGELADVPGLPTRAARRVANPPAGDPLSATVDLFFAVDNKDGAFRPGQRVGVTLPLKGTKAGLVVPLAALLRDFDGGVWVYESIGSHKYARRRVRVDGVIGDMASLSAGPRAGAQVVTDGAAEVFGSEFGSK